MSLRSILIVDDDVAVRESLHDELAPLFDVTCVDGGDQALALLGSRRFDLLLSDVRMPGMDGVELVRRAKRIDPEMMRVLLTAYADEDARLVARERDGVYKLSKPWKDELESVLLRALEHRERVRRMSEMVGHMDRLAALGRMLLSVVHDMSSPLSYIQANVNSLARDLVSGSDQMRIDPGEVGELIHDVREGVGRIVDLVQRVRQYAVPTRAEPTVTALSTMVDSALRVTHSQFRHRMAVEVRKQGEDPLVTVTGRDVEQIVVNLLLNAAQAMDWKGHVTIDVGSEDGWARLAVSDEGPGVPAEVQERLFDPFYADDAGGGLGLGLAVSHDLAERCGGRLTVKSEPGHGATFTLELPRVASA
jgi:two-component system, NtrC family, sensor kinase